MKLLLVLLVLLPAFALARTVESEFQLGAVDCEGDAVAPSEYVAIEFYVDDVPIPTQGPCVLPVDTPPAGAQVVSGNLTNNTVTFNLPAGTWYTRARVQDNTGAWSNLSQAQLTLTVPPGLKQPPIVIRFELGG